MSRLAFCSRTPKHPLFREKMEEEIPRKEEENALFAANSITSKDERHFFGGMLLNVIERYGLKNEKENN